MRSPAGAIAWEIWGKNRWAFPVALGTVVLCALGNPILSHVLDKRSLAYNISGWAMFISLYTTCGIFCYVESDPTGRYAGFPSRMFTLPVRTFTLVTWPILYGITTVVLVYLAWALLVFRPLGMDFPLGWPSLLLATTLVGMQALVWANHRLPWIRLIVVSQVGLLLCLLVANLLIFGVAPSLDEFWTKFLLVAPVLLYFYAWRGVEADRRGGGWAWWQTPVDAVSHALPRSSSSQRPFSSPLQAQLWFEWRRTSTILPIALGLTLALTLCIAFLIGDFDLVTVASLFNGFMPLVIGIVAFVTGIALGDLPAAVAIRPITSGDLALMKLKAAAIHAMTAWCVYGTLTLLLWLSTTKDAQEIWLTLVPQTAGYGIPIALLRMIVILFALVGLTWKIMVAGFCPSVTGRQEILVLYAAAFISGAALTGWVIKDDEAYQIASALLPTLLPVLLGIAFTLKAGGAFLCFKEAYRQRFISSRAIWKYLIIWVAGTGCFVAWGLVQSYGPASIVAAIAAILFPLLRVGLAPLALAWNRHR